MKPKIKKMYGLGLVVEYFRLKNRCFLIEGISFYKGDGGLMGTRRKTAIF